jgi:hypothetical protein
MKSHTRVVIVGRGMMGVGCFTILPRKDGMTVSLLKKEN